MEQIVKLIIEGIETVILEDDSIKAYMEPILADLDKEQEKHKAPPKSDVKVNPGFYP